MINRLWLDFNLRVRLREAWQAREDWICPMGERIFSDSEDCTPDTVLRVALRCLLGGGPDNAAKAVDDWCRLAESARNVEDLGKAHIALSGAGLVDSTLDDLNEAQRTKLASAIDGLMGFFFQTSPGNPHSVANNWWAVTHSALFCLACARQCLEVDGGQAAGRAAAEIEEWTWGRLTPFLGHFGPGGAYHEGLGYMGYTCANLLPAVHLWQLRNGSNILKFAPGLEHMASLVFGASIEGPCLSDETGVRSGSGRTLSWNDAGLGFLQGSAPLLAIALAPRGERRPLRDFWDRLAGHLRPDGGDHEFSCALFFHLVFYGFCDGGDQRPRRSVFDPLHGLWIARNRFQDGHDAVAGAYACGYQPGGHRQEDAGSIRFSALGWDWILGGGQARAEAEWQSRLVPSDHSSNTGKRCGSVLHASDWGFGMDLRAVHIAYSERYVALNPEAEAQMAILDIVDDHRTDRFWNWCLTFSPEMKVSMGIDSFTLTAPDGSLLTGVFLLDRPVEIQSKKMPDSRRTFANGQKREYPGRPFLKARFEGPSLNILVSIKAVRTGGAATRLAAPGTLDLVGADGTIWKRPFGVAIPATFEGRLRGLCKFPEARNPQ